MSDVELITTEYGLREIPRQNLYGRNAPSPREYAELDKALRRYRAQHPGLRVLRDDRSAQQGGIVLVWMPETMYREYVLRVTNRPSYTVRQFFEDIEAATQERLTQHRELEQRRMREITNG